MRVFGKDMITPHQRFKAKMMVQRNPSHGLNNSKRIEKAIELLTYYNLTPIEIAYQLNYSNVDEFVNHFKNVVGLSPERYKQLRTSDSHFRIK